MSQSDLPPVSQRDESPTGRVTTRLRYVAYASATIFVTVYCYMLHPALGLAMTFVAKHVLVAILAAALRLPIRDVEESSRGA